jgi:hypothetical protein
MKSINIILYRKGLIKPFTVEVFRFDGEVLSVAPTPSSFIQRSIDEAYEDGFWYLECTDGSQLTVNMKNIDMVAWNVKV